MNRLVFAQKRIRTVARIRKIWRIKRADFCGVKAAPLHHLLHHGAPWCRLQSCFAAPRHPHTPLGVRCGGAVVQGLWCGADGVCAGASGGWPDLNPQILRIG